MNIIEVEVSAGMLTEVAEINVSVGGVRGIDGSNGTNGNQITLGHGPPSGSATVPGDLYIDLDTWELYQWS